MRLIVRSAGCLALAAAVLAGCAPQPEAPAAKDPYAVQVGPPGQATCLATAAAHNAAGAQATNRARARAGLPPVQPDPQLARVAAQHACDMALRGRMTHLGSTTTGPSMRLKQTGYQPSIAAENIAAGPFSLNRVLSEWTASPGHLDNILLPQVRDFGVGQALAEDGRTVYWAAVYAAPR
ncbi:MAG: CAP domain-containing protein [Paracoccus hibiscisoli]|uniref:CAP domain-containing protein n=1 Tax=Paracoccus hibiscisoli TaxID=2023261 RepID=UPI0039196AAF